MKLVVTKDREKFCISSRLNGTWIYLQKSPKLGVLSLSEYATNDGRMDGWFNSAKEANTAALTFADKYSLEVQLYVEPIEVRLNDTYTAVVTKESITVGCQTFSTDIVEKLVQALKELR